MSGLTAGLRKRLGLTLFLGVVAAALLTPACAQGPPQIVDISPARGATDVRTNTPIAIRFDRPVDRLSVASRLQLFDLGKHPLVEIPPRACPDAAGTLTATAVNWQSAREALLEHPVLKPDTEYQAVLRGGYGDTTGQVSGLCHYWTFTTESPPRLTDVSPGDGDRNVDPATYLTLSFSREMNLDSLRSAIAVQPELVYNLQPLPGDPRTVRLAPQTLLAPGASYSMAVRPQALDVDGNHLADSVRATFTTGGFRGLHHWITFAATPDPPGTPQSGQGVWVVDEGKFPRRIASGAVQDFSWSADGRHLLLNDETGAWSDLAVGSQAKALPFRARWAVPLGGSRGYVYLEGSQLSQLTGDGTTVAIATGAREAALSPDGRRLAFTVATGDSTEIWAYELDLRTRFRLVVEPKPIKGLAWSGDSLRLAYVAQSPVPQQSQVRVKDLGASGRVTTLATGDVGAPIWEPDSVHVLLPAQVMAPLGLETKLFVVNSSAPAAPLTATQGMPASDLEPLTAMPSPDGHQIAFLAQWYGHVEVWLMNADGSGLTQLTTYDATSFPYSCRALAWTPT